MKFLEGVVSVFPSISIFSVSLILAPHSLVAQTPLPLANPNPPTRPPISQNVESSAAAATPQQLQPSAASVVASPSPATATTTPPPSALTSPTPTSQTIQGPQQNAPPRPPEVQERMRYPFYSPPGPSVPPVIEEEEQSDYQVFPLQQVDPPQQLPPSPSSRIPQFKHMPAPGYGEGERILFPPPFEYTWPIFYLDKHQELCFALPMSEGPWGTGHWFGLRHILLDEGVNFIGGYATDMQGNVCGGLSPGFAYVDTWQIRADIDLQRLVGWPGALLVLSVIDRNGRNLTAQNIGNFFNVAQLWGSQTFNYYALWLDQNFFDGWVNLKFGRVAVTDDFLSNPAVYGVYVSNAIDGQPFAAAVGGRLSTYPASTWGARLRYNDEVHNIYLMFGIYQTTNRLYKPAYHGFDFSTRCNDGINLLWEVGWVPEFQPHPRPKPQNAASSNKKGVISPGSPLPEEPWHGLPGKYKFGVFYTSWRHIPQFDPNRNTFYSYGVYWLVDQMVYQEAPGSNQGLTLWSIFVYAPVQNTALMTFQYSGGFIYAGLLPGRSHDLAIFGIFYGSLSKYYARSQQEIRNGYPTYELVLEWSYRINLSSIFYIQPDIQYVIRPGGTGRIPNALVLGAQIGFNF